MSTIVVTETVPKVYPPGPQSKDTDVYPHAGYLRDSVFGEDEGDDTGGTYELHALPAHLSDRSRRISTISRAPFDPSFRPSDSKLSAGSVPRDVTIDVSESDLPVLPSLRLHSATERRKFHVASIVHFAALCWCLFVEGWNDGSTGPLLPVIQRDYHIGFSIVSLYFVSNCAGFISGAALNVWLNDRIGFGKIVVLGSIFQLVGYVMQAPGPPFPVMVIANAFTGFGLSLQNAQANGFVGSLEKHMTTKLGMMHAAYGLGAFTSPFVATFFSGTRRWSFHYLVSAVLAISNTLTLALIFRGKPLDELLAEGGQASEEQTSVRQTTYRELFGLKAVHILAIFALVYIGIEVTVGGWIVTFIIHERGGGQSTGYISSGFFGGLTLGRIGLMWFTKLVGEHRVIFVYSLLSIALEITVWVVPSIVENAVAVALIGVVLGPMFPVLVSHATKVLPRWLLTVCLGWITGVGIAGSAALPFLTGLLSSRFGIGALQPLLVSMMCVMVQLRRQACLPSATLRLQMRLGEARVFAQTPLGLARCINLSVSGTTTNTNTFATIQFGHNDQKVMDTATFASNLESLTQEIMNARCSPILITSLYRRTFSDGTLTDILEPYSNQTIAVATKLNFAPTSTAYRLSILHPETRQSADVTHLNPLGALYFGRMVADEVKKIVPALAPNIKADAGLSAKIAAGTL
ncbi:Bypass of stop codon protein 6 [Hypsizygus marmoreus]|uniref:Bypass of stop codon protein 6 n=1 Tax=Hypsizygus marmoreus TaxID=39966 RepID=A0A369KGB4_HYPMA|nr:Bypass of stop codon protein 6 [Hypsizygus marmoreus]